MSKVMQMTLEEAIQHARQQEWMLKETQQMDCAEEHRQLVGWLTELKVLREQTRWIPCEEKLPDKFVKVLISIKDQSVDAMMRVENWLKTEYHWEDSTGIYGHDSKDVLAWMPLPTSYQEENNDNGVH